MQTAWEMNFRGALLLTAGLAACFSITGCGTRQLSQKQTTAVKPAAVSAQRAANSRTAPPLNQPLTVQPAAKRDEQWSERIAQAQSALAAGRVDDAQSALLRLDGLFTSKETPTAEQEQERQNLELQIAAARREALDRRREEHLAAGQQAMDLGRFDEALRLAAEVVKENPSPAQQERAAALRVEVRRRQQVKKDWQPHLEKLGSSARRDLEAAQAELKKDPEAALSVLAELSQRTDQPALAVGALETLAVLDRPQRALPLLVAVLKRDSQRDLWQVATQQIVKIGQVGAGESLLTLALANGSVDQRLAALAALSQVIDPPPRTLAALLPLLYDDGPLLRLALQAAAHGASVHNQFDLVGSRGLEAELASVQEEQLAKLPDRLQALAGAGGDRSGDVALAAQSLAVALRLLPPQPLTGLKVHQVAAEVPEGPAAAAIDGVWNSTDPKSMWRHPADQRGSITLDLGQERTVVAVKLWNWNEPGGIGRGWKEVEIFVGKSDAELASVARGIVPLAPGVGGTPDYGTIISVPCVRVRYVRLQASSLWQTNSHSGLAEIEVLGF